MDFSGLTLFQLVAPFVVVIISIILHEIAHGYAAYRLGDWTAKIEGRLTLNPIPHIDPIGTLAMPLLLSVIGSPVVFGYAKPVPVNYFHLREGERGRFYVAIAGIVVNALLVVLATAVFRSVDLLPVTAVSGFIAAVAYYFITINLLLILFNLLPIPPLDGSRILRTVLPPGGQQVLDSLESVGIVLVFLFLFTFQGRLAESVGRLTAVLTGL